MLRIGEATPGRDEAQLYQYTFKVSADVEFDVIGGDDRVRNLRLHPVERPAVKSLAIECEYPAYLERAAAAAARERAAAPSCPRAPRPSAAPRRTSRSSSVTVHDPAEQVDLPARQSRRTIPREFEFDLGRIAADRVLLITMHDADGVENRDPFRLAVSAVPDQPPEVNVQLRGIGTAVTPQARIPLAGRLTGRLRAGRGVVRVRSGRTAAAAPAAAHAARRAWPISA